jgi:hypothetical protein
VVDPVSGVDYLERLGSELVAARELRHEKAEVFDDVPTEALEAAVRGLRAISYSAETGARHLARIVEERRRANEVPTATAEETRSAGPRTFEDDES